MKKKTTQDAFVLGLLRRRTVTAIELNVRHGVSCPTARIAALRADGWRITSTREKASTPHGQWRETVRYRLTSKRRGPSPRLRAARAASTPSRSPARIAGITWETS